MSRHLAIAIGLAAVGAGLLLYALLASAGGASAPLAGLAPAADDLQVLPSAAALAPLRPELALGDHPSPFAQGRAGAGRGPRIPLPPPPPVAPTPLPVLPLPER